MDQEPRTHLDESFLGIRGAHDGHVLPEEAYELRHSVVVHGIRRVCKEYSRSDIAQFIEGLDDARLPLSVGDVEAACNELKEAGLTELSERLYAKFMPSSSSATAFSEMFRRWDEGEVVFFECVRAAAGGNESESADQAYSPPVALSAIYDALGVWNAAAKNLVFLAERIGLDEAREVLRGTIAALGLDANIVRRQASARIDAIVNGKRRQSIIQVTSSPEWERALEIELNPTLVGHALLHPYTPIACGAAQLIDAGAVGDLASNLLRHALDNGQDATLYLVARLAERVWGDGACEILLERVGKRLVSGCQHLLLAPVELGSSHHRQEIIAALLDALDGDDAEIAVGAAEAMATLNPALEPVYADRLQQAYDRWLKIEDPYPEDFGTVPPSPRAILFNELNRISRWAVDDLIRVEADDRHDVAETARRWLVIAAKDDPLIFGDLLQRVDRGNASLNLLRDLLQAPEDVLKARASDILFLLRSGNGKVRTVIVGQLANSWVDRTTALEELKNALEDDDPAVRTQATRTLRILR